MSTRYYLTKCSSGQPLIGPGYLGLKGAWDDSVSGGGIGRDILAEWCLQLSTSKANGGRRNFLNVPAREVTEDRDILLMRFMTNPLEAQTISGTINTCIRSGGTNFDGSVTKWHIHAYIAEGLSVNVRHVLLDNYIDSAAWFDTRFRSLASAQTLISGSALAGDRLIIEIGARISSTTVDSAAFIDLGTLASVSSGGGALPDAAVNDQFTDEEAGYLDFSHTFVEQAVPAAPANDACADAIVVSSLPYSHGPIDTTQSTDTKRSVWYKFTAPRDGTVNAHSFLSNYAIYIKPYTGACGSLTLLPAYRLSSGFLWVQRSQAYTSFPVTAGTTYTLQVTSEDDGGPESSSNSGGSLTFGLFYDEDPLDGDLVINAQYISSWRDGQLVRLVDGFFGLTPSGSAIDFTRRPIADYASDDFPALDNTNLRVLFGIFGTTPFVEVYDLPGGTEANLMFNAADFGGAKHIASIIFDPQGRVLFGYYGDNYSALGELPTDPASAYVRRVDGVAGLEDPGPAADPEVFAVEFENSGAEFLDVTSDGNTLFYTSAGRRILRFDLAGNVQLPDFALLPDQGDIPRPGAHGLRLLPPGDGTRGMLVTAGDVVYRLDGSGTIIQTYTPSATERAQNLDKVELTPERDAFWVSDQFSTSLFKFDLDTGEQLDDVDTGLPIGQLCGFSVVGGYRAGVAAYLVEDIPLPNVVNNSAPCCETSPPTPTSTGATGPRPTVMPLFDFQRTCEGGGEVPSAPEIIDSESWAV